MSLRALLAFGMTLGLTACPKAVVDTDDEPGKPGVAALSLGAEHSDALDVPGGDSVDWLSLVSDADGTAMLEVVVGDAFGGPHGLTGSVSVFTSSAESIEREAITPGEHRVALSWPVDEGRRYLVKLEASKGASAYTVRVRIKAKPKDPCADVSCGGGEVCEGGRCVPAGCAGGCPAGQACHDGLCQRACGGCPVDYCCDASAWTCYRDECPGKDCAISRPCR